MIKDLETLGLKVEDITPSQNKDSVSIDSNITIKFNSYLNKATIVNNVILLNATNEERIPCSVKLVNDTVIVTPKELLSKKEKYLVYIPKNGISDILGRKLLIDFKSYFITEIESYHIKPKVTEPKNGIYPTLPQLIFTSPSKNNIIEISNSKSFNLIVYSSVSNSHADGEVIHKMETNLQDGLYYIRIKTEDNVVSDLTQFYLSSGEGRVSNSDYAVEVNDLGIDESNELLEFKPSKDIVEINRRCVYYVFDGKVDTDIIKKCKSYIVGESIDESDEDIESHGYLDYEMIYMYDCVEQKTYIIFEINEGDDVEKNSSLRK